MALGRRDTEVEGVVLAAKILLSVFGIGIAEVLVLRHVWADWLTWWSGPLMVLALVWGGFWFCMWLWEVVSDGEF